MLTHEDLLTAIPNCLNKTDFPELGSKYEGKVRDVYVREGHRVLITTDRISAFGRVLGRRHLPIWPLKRIQDQGAE